MDVVKETPLMKQYQAVKAKYPGTILLFRIGDFYETFGEDAILTSKILGIVLTKRANGAAAHVDLAGFPHHALNTYLPKLVRAGQRVAICDQLEDPKLAKKIVKRGVTDVVSPGVAYSDRILEHKSNNYLAAVYAYENKFGIAMSDVSTGEFFVSEGDKLHVEKLMRNFLPSEVLISKSFRNNFSEWFGEKFYVHAMEDWIFQQQYGYETLVGHFKTNSLKGFGVQEMNHAIVAAGAILHYLKEYQNSEPLHISKVYRLADENYVWMDATTIRNLELLNSMYYVPADSGRKARTLYEVLDRTITAMGARMLRRWITLPLRNVTEIQKRLNAVENLLNKNNKSENLRALLKQTGDLERLTARLSMQKINAREINVILKSLQALTKVKEELFSANDETLKRFSELLNPCMGMQEKIFRTIADNPPSQIGNYETIRTGVSAELDELRTLSSNGKQYLQQMQKQEIQNTGIPSLKISYNNVFGYYIEITNTHKDKVPPHYVRKQTLTNCERYITPELKEYEEKILHAEEKILALENSIYNQLVKELSEYIVPVQQDAMIIAQVDCLLCFAQTAEENNYVKPEVNDSTVIDIKDGRHPVIEKTLPEGESYIPNDVYLDTDEQQILIITGPNMAGKSALIRQVALITLMAQTGSFVPAQSASIGIADKIFARVGASDNLAAGESTFMVEMNEAANIINNATGKSLILFDEVGRGTSTYDGVSIAWSLVEYLHDNENVRVGIHACGTRTLFATHYHELNEITKDFPRVKNFHISVKEADGKVLFLRKLLPGGSEHSFGIHVAEMAGLPQSIITRAREILEELEEKHVGAKKTTRVTMKRKIDEHQLNIFNVKDASVERIKRLLEETDVNTLTPVEALLKIQELKMLLGKV